MLIEYFKRTNYGTSHLYIVDPEVKKWVGLLTDKKTINNLDMVALAGLGFKFKQVINPEDNILE